MALLIILIEEYMTREQLRDKARQIGRVTTTVSDAVLDDFLNEAAIQFSRDTGLLLKKIHFVVREKFDLGTNEAFRLYIETAGEGYLVNGLDVALATALTDKTGAEIASALQAIIQASGIGASNTLVTFSQSTRKFTIDASAETSVAGIKVATPAAPGTYYDAAYKLFGVDVEDSASGVSYTGAASPYCTSEFKLPTDFIEVEELVYAADHDYPLAPEIYFRRRSKEGTPDWYSIYNKSGGKYIRITDQPVTYNKQFELMYRYKPAAIATGSAGDASEYPIPSDYDYAIIHYAVYLAKLMEEDAQSAFTHKALYEQQKDNAICDELMQLGEGINLSQRGRSGL